VATPTAANATMTTTPTTSPADANIAVPLF
jgi:hypothetical protein